MNTIMEKGEKLCLIRYLYESPKATLFTAALDGQILNSGTQNPDHAILVESNDFIHL